MKPTYIALLALCLCLAGCGKKDVEKAATKEPELRSEKVITPDEAANELFVEAVELVGKAQAEEGTDIASAIKRYEQALVKVRKIVNDYKKSDLAVKLVSGETLFTGKSMVQIEGRVAQLKNIPGTYEEVWKGPGLEVVGYTLNLMLMANNAIYAGRGGKKISEGTWNISKENELHIFYSVSGGTEIFQINKDGGLTTIAIKEAGKEREDMIGGGTTYKKIK